MPFFVGLRGMKAAYKKLMGLIPGYDPVATAGDCVFDERAAQLALDFFPIYLRHVKGELAGKPFALGLWEQAILANLFGWMRPDGTRRYRKVFLLVPRKNGKTTFAAGIVCYVLFCDGEPGAETYSAAAERDQAGLVFEQVAGMVRQDPDLRGRATVYTKSIVLKNHSGSYKPISSDANTKFGYNTHLAVVDEVHAHKTRDLIDALETSTGSRRQPLIVYLTTRDYDHPSICNEKQGYAEKVRDGIIEDPSFLPVLFETSRDANWQDEKVWARANPNLGVSVKLSDMREDCLQAMETPAFENTFKRMRLNMATEQATRWLNLESWDKCGGAIVEEALFGQKCYAGLDLASTSDLTALTLFFPEADNAVLPFFWVPADNAHKRERRDRVPYETWARQGFITLTPGNVTDYTFVRETIKALGGKYSIQQIAYDPYNATHLAIELQEEDGFEMVQFRQGWVSMNEPMKRLDMMIKSGNLRHGGHPVLRWNASNVAVKTDPSSNMRPDKEHSSEKIDGIVALIMAIGLSISGGSAEKPSVYETRGVLTV